MEGKRGQGFHCPYSPLGPPRMGAALLCICAEDHSSCVTALGIAPAFVSSSLRVRQASF